MCHQMAQQHEKKEKAKNKQRHTPVSSWCCPKETFFLHDSMTNVVNNSNMYS